MEIDYDKYHYSRRFYSYEIIDELEPEIINIKKEDIVSYFKGEKELSSFLYDKNKEKVYYYERNFIYKVDINDVFKGFEALKENNKSSLEIIDFINSLLDFDYYFDGLVVFDHDNPSSLILKDPYLEKPNNFLFILFKTFEKSLSEKASIRIYEEYLIVFKEYMEAKSNHLNYKDHLMSFMIYFSFYFEAEIREDSYLFSYIRFHINRLKDKDLYFLDLYLAYSYNESDFLEHNYFKAEKYLLKAYEKYNEAFLANVLGYIYYYGRVNNGIRDYEKAFKYYALAALSADITEAKCKLFDILMSAESFKKSEEAALSILESIEREERDCDYYLRKAGLYEKGIIFKKDLKEARILYLAAKLSSNKKVKENDFFGYKEVNIRLFKKLEELKDKSFKREIDKDYLGFKMNDDEFISTIDFSFFNAEIEDNDLKLKGNDSYYLSEKYNFVYRDYSSSLRFIFKNVQNIKLIKKYLTNYKYKISFKDKEIIVSNSKRVLKKFKYSDFIVISDDLNFLETHNYVDILFKENDVKSYLYSVNKEYEVNSFIKVILNGEIKKVKVIRNYKVYSDEIPLGVKELEVVE